MIYTTATINDLYYNTGTQYRQICTNTPVGSSQKPATVYQSLSTSSCTIYNTKLWNWKRKLQVHTSCAAENQAVELEWIQMTCSPALWDVNVNRPSIAYIFTPQTHTPFTAHYSTSSSQYSTVTVLHCTILNKLLYCTTLYLTENSTHKILTCLSLADYQSLVNSNTITSLSVTPVNKCHYRVQYISLWNAGSK